MAEPLSGPEVLARLPKQEPSRFIDEILELDDQHIVASYRFREVIDGTIDGLFDYWIMGKNAGPSGQRWSIIRDVLHWVD